MWHDKGYGVWFTVTTRAQATGIRIPPQIGDALDFPSTLPGVLRGLVRPRGKMKGMILPQSPGR
jgi:hypothetical protein